MADLLDTECASDSVDDIVGRRSHRLVDEEYAAEGVDRLGGSRSVESRVLVAKIDDYRSACGETESGLFCHCIILSASAGLSFN